MNSLDAGPCASSLFPRHFEDLVYETSLDVVMDRRLLTLFVFCPARGRRDTRMTVDL